MMREWRKSRTDITLTDRKGKDEGVRKKMVKQDMNTRHERDGINMLNG